MIRGKFMLRIKKKTIKMKLMKNRTISQHTPNTGKTLLINSKNHSKNFKIS